MRISDSFLKSHLGNVFWIGGGARGGKTTVADLVAQKHGLVAYHQEDMLAEHWQAARGRLQVREEGQRDHYGYAIASACSPLSRGTSPGPGR